VARAVPGAGEFALTVAASGPDALTRPPETTTSLSRSDTVLRWLYAAGLIGILLLWSALAVLGTVDPPAAGRVIGSVEAAAQVVVSSRWWS
jgi:hypothetical protein